MRVMRSTPHCYVGTIVAAPGGAQTGDQGLGHHAQNGNRGNNGHHGGDGDQADDNGDDDEAERQRRKEARARRLRRAYDPLRQDPDDEDEYPADAVAMGYLPDLDARRWREKRMRLARFIQFSDGPTIDDDAVEHDLAQSLDLDFKGEIQYQRHLVGGDARGCTGSFRAARPPPPLSQVMPRTNLDALDGRPPPGDPPPSDPGSDDSPGGTGEGGRPHGASRHVRSWFPSTAIQTLPRQNQQATPPQTPHGPPPQAAPQHAQRPPQQTPQQELDTARRTREQELSQAQEQTRQHQQDELQLQQEQQRRQNILQAQTQQVADLLAQSPGPSRWQGWQVPNGHAVADQQQQQEEEEQQQQYQQQQEQQQPELDEVHRQREAQRRREAQRQREANRREYERQTTEMDAAAQLEAQRIAQQMRDQQAQQQANKAAAQVSETSVNTALLPASNSLLPKQTTKPKTGQGNQNTKKPKAPKRPAEATAAQGAPDPKRLRPDSPSWNEDKDEDDTMLLSTEDTGTRGGVERFDDDSKRPYRPGEEPWREMDPYQNISLGLDEFDNEDNNLGDSDRPEKTFTGAALPTIVAPSDNTSVPILGFPNQPPSLIPPGTSTAQTNTVPINMQGSPLPTDIRDILHWTRNSESASPTPPGAGQS